MKNSARLLNCIWITASSCFFLLLESFGQFGNAQIVYTDVDPSTIGNPYNLDLNNDGIADFVITTSSFSHQCGLNFCAQTVTDHSTTISPLGSNEVADYYANVANLSSLTPIDSNLIWKHNANQLISSSTYHCVFGSGCELSQTGWNVGYIGLKLILNGNSYYGWVGWGTSSTNKDYAYNSVAGKPIFPGQTVCMLVSNADAVIAAYGPTTFCYPPDEVQLKVDSLGFFYQWKKDGVDIPKAVNQSYYAFTSGSYSCDVSGCGIDPVISNSIEVTANSVAAIISPSGIINICQGQSTTLSANTGVNFSYKWKRNGSMIWGATNSTLLVTEAGKYKVVVTDPNTGCNKKSKATTVNITCKVGEALNDEKLSVNPNPFSVSATVSFYLPSTQSVSLNIYDLQGRLIRILANESMSEGEHTLSWDARDENGNKVNAGIYLVKLQTISSSKAISLSVIK